MSSENSTKEIAAVKEQVRLEAWRRESEAQRASGLSVKAWCAWNGVSQSGYYHRLRRLREAVCRQIGAEQETAGSGAACRRADTESGHRGHKFSVNHRD